MWTVLEFKTEDSLLLLPGQLMRQTCLTSAGVLLSSQIIWDVQICGRSQSKDEEQGHSPISAGEWCFSHLELGWLSHSHSLAYWRFEHFYRVDQLLYQKFRACVSPWQSRYLGYSRSGLSISKGTILTQVLLLNAGEASNFFSIFPKDQHPKTFKMFLVVPTSCAVTVESFGNVWTPVNPRLSKSKFLCFIESMLSL